MRRTECIKGKEVGNNGVIYLSELPKQKNHRKALFRCHCGNEFECLVHSISSNTTTSCGCAQKEVARKLASKLSYKHGMSWHPLHHVWVGMKKRCYDKKNCRYHRYGGRGIHICDEWLNDCKMFIEWGDANGYKQGLQIDRINNDKGYSPDNCRFVTNAENAKNKGVRVDNKTGVSGVEKVKKKWKV